MFSLIKSFYYWLLSHEKPFFALVMMNVAVSLKFLFPPILMGEFLWLPVFILVGGVSGFIMGLIVFFIVYFIEKLYLFITASPNS